MPTTVETLISLPKPLFEQAELLAQHLNFSQNQLFESALAQFIRSHHNLPDLDEATTQPTQRVVINQGDIYWAYLENPNVPEASIPHPYVIIQENVLNHSRIDSVVACALTSNIGRISNTPGNLLLEPGEANLPKQSVVEVSKVSTLAKSALGEYIGSLSEQRVSQILTGMRFLQRSFLAR